VLQIVYASIGLALGLGVLAISGAVAVLVGASAPFGDLLVAVPVRALIGLVASSLLIVLSLPRLVAGIGLLRMRPWARVLTIIASVLGCLDFPFGTALGGYGIWVLSHRNATVLFEGEPTLGQPQTASI
jgi:hypothetical protein